MSKVGSSQPLVPHWQREFLDKVVNATPPATFILRVPSGGGKTAVITALIASVLRTPTATVLVASSRRDILQTYREVLDPFDKPIMVTAFARYVRDQSEPARGRPAAGAYLATYDLLKRPEARQTLERTVWDLVVLDDNVSESMLHNIWQPIKDSLQVEKLIVVEPNESPLSGTLSEYFGNPEVYSFRAPSSLHPKYRIDALMFKRSEAEAMAVQLALSSFNDSSKLKTRLARSADSSLAAFEREIFNLRNNIVHRGEAEALVYEGPGAEDLNEAPDLRTNEFILPRLMAVLNEVRMVHDDAKTDALVYYIKEHRDDRTAIITSYPATATYLRTILKELDGTNERNAAVFTPNDYKILGGGDFSTLVLFDLPWDRRELEHNLQVAFSQLPIHPCGLKIMIMTDEDQLTDLKKKVTAYQDGPLL